MNVMFLRNIKNIFILILIPVKIFGQSFTSYYTGNPSDTVTNPEGGICLMGGATEHDEAMKWFLKQKSVAEIFWF